MTIGSHVSYLADQSYGVGIIVDIGKTGLLRVIWDDDFDDWFHALELEEAMGATAASEFPLRTNIYRRPKA